MSKPFYKNNTLIGAAFLMATSAIGPGFLTQTAVFTQKLAANFGFIILISLLIDIAVQLNIWRIITMTEKPAQVIANETVPYTGALLAILMVGGGFAFNAGNMAGCGLAVNLLFDISATTGAFISCLLAISIFVLKEFGKALDHFAKWLGLLMIALTCYVAYKANPPLGIVLQKTFMPDIIDTNAIITLVGGTVGGYISFAGAHRLLDAGIKGNTNLKYVQQSAVSGILITGIMRIILFLAAYGVVAAGLALAKDNPASSIFESVLGNTGRIFFGIVLWCAAITSVVGCAYTSISFLKSIHPLFDKYQRNSIIIFIVLSFSIFAFFGKPVQLLVKAGMINGMILPMALLIMLLAVYKQKSAYKHPLWLGVIGLLAAIILGWMALKNYFI